jgi:hypothetical protein
LVSDPRDESKGEVGSAGSASSAIRIVDEAMRMPCWLPPEAASNDFVQMAIVSAKRIWTAQFISYEFITLRNIVFLRKCISGTKWSDGEKQFVEKCMREWTGEFV